MTIKEAASKARDAGCTLTWKPHVSEYRVNLLRGTEATAYYTNDRQDAVDTARQMGKVKQSWK